MITFDILSLIFPYLSLALAVVVLGKTISYVREEVLGHASTGAEEEELP